MPRLFPRLAYAALLALFACSDDPPSSPTACSGSNCSGNQDNVVEGDDDDTDEDDDSVAPVTQDAGAVKRDAKVELPTDASGPKSDPPSGNELPCEIEAIVEAHCGTCHGATPQFNAPMALVDADDFRTPSADGKNMITLVKERINHGDPKVAMPPPSGKQLTAAQKSTLNAWLDKGALGVATRCAAADAGAGDAAVDEPAAPISDSDLECHKLLAHSGDLKSKYKVGVANDAYFTFTYAPPWKETAYGVVLRPIIDNTKVIHHWLLFQDDLPGIPGGAVPTIGAHPAGQLLHGWAPGGDPLDFRKAGVSVGLELPSNTTYTIEFHYNSRDAAALDASGVEICVAKQKPKNIAAISWLGNDNLLLPSTTWVGNCIPVSQERIHIVAVVPHMHLQGKHMKAVINRKSGMKEILHDEPFDFDYQRLYNKDVWIEPGDTITTECTFKQPMMFGESTNAEMCYLFTAAYPKGALAGLDLWGRFAHGGSSCLGM